MQLKHLNDADLHGKTVVLRVDFNVPLNENQEIEDDTRIQSTLPTIQHILSQNAKLVIISHLGRPKGEIVEKLRLTPIGKRLSELLGIEVQKLHESIGEKVESAISSMNEKDVILLENIRFIPGEEDNDAQLGKQLAKFGDVFVNDAFACCHRAHASIVGIPQHLPSYAGFLVANEVESLSNAFDENKHPITLVLGGAKVDTKIGIIENFIEKADYILFGGALANTFLVASGFDVGESMYEKDKLELAQEIMLKAEQTGCHIKLPTDSIVADELNESAKALDLPVEDLELDMKIFDIGKNTAEYYAKIIAQSKLVIWNGPVGVHEFEHFAKGSKAIANAMKATEASTIIGGGDSIDFLERYGYQFADFTHVSTAGGAMIEFLEGKELPGIAALQE